MSHHFDSPTAREDPRLNIADFYLFAPRPGHTAMAMTVNPNAGSAAPGTFRDEGVYAFRFDLNNDAKEELTFRVLFGEVRHAEDGRHEQTVKLLVARDDSAFRGVDGDVLANGLTNMVVDGQLGVRLFAGLAPDLFAADSAALHAFKASIADGRFDPSPFESHQNYFADRNVTAIVVEVPNHLIGEGEVRAWTTVSLFGHAPEIQVARWGLPPLTHFFILEADDQEHYNRSTPAEDSDRTMSTIRDAVNRIVTLADSSSTPAGYADAVARRLVPTTLPYRVGTPASFDFVSFNGRSFADDVMDVMLTIMTNTALGDGVRPDRTHFNAHFPYFAEPYEMPKTAG
jgi:hypothetical protein